MEGQSVKPPKCQMGPYTHQNTGKKTELHVPLSIIKSTDVRNFNYWAILGISYLSILDFTQTLKMHVIVNITAKQSRDIIMRSQ